MKIWVFFLTLVLASGAFAQKACFGVGLEHRRIKNGESFLPISPERVVSYELVMPLKDSHPTLVFLPGIFRGLEQKDPALQSLLKEGFGTLRTTTSDHWESLKGLESTEARLPREESGGVGYARETTQLIHALNVSKPVTISLSYSSVVLASMKGRRIFVSPMVKASDSDPVAASALKTWESLLAMNPFLGSSAIRSNRDSNYRSFWSPIVSARLKADPNAYGVGTSRELVIESYMRLSRSTEDFNLVKMMEKTEGPVDFVLAEKESKVALRGQIESAMAAAKRFPVRVILVRDAEHNVPDSQPAAYESAIKELSLNEGTGGLRLGVIDPRRNPSDIRWLSETDTRALLHEVLRYPESTSPADFTPVFGP